MNIQMRQTNELEFGEFSGNTGKDDPEDKPENL